MATTGVSLYNQETWGYLSSASINALVATALAQKQKQLSALQQKASDLQVVRAAISDLATKLSALDAVAEQLAGLSPSYTFGAARTAAISDATVIRASAADAASTGSFSLNVMQLAKAHSIRSAQISQPAEPLGLSGTFYIGGLASAAASAEVTDTVVTGFAAAPVGEGLAQLGSGAYYVELRQYAGAWQFRLVDEEGSAVEIARADGQPGTTSTWQSLSAVAGRDFDTGRGLVISFSQAEPASAKYFGEAGAPRVRYTAQGALISVQAGDSLLDIRDKINAATYAAGNELTASVVDRHLVLTVRRTGERFAIRGEDVEGSILASLELLSGGSPVHELQAAQNALITVNGTLTVSRSRNSGLTDVISGVTLDLLKAGTAELTVGVDLSAAQNKIQELVAKFNDAIGYLRAKTGLTLSSSGGYKENRTYSRGTLYGDSLLAGLRYSLHQVLLARYEHGSLAQLGFSIDGTNMTIRLTDSAALSSALANDFQSVAALVKEVAAAVNSALDPYIEDANESIIARRGADLGKQIGMYDKRVKQMQERLQAEETNLRNQYYRLQQQFVASLQRRQEWLVFGGAGLLGGLLG